MQPIEQRLGIERLEMARPARHEQKDDRFRLRRPMRCARLSAKPFVVKHGGERERADAAAGGLEEGAAIS
jgi:hypothetical protein